MIGLSSVAVVFILFSGCCLLAVAHCDLNENFETLNGLGHGSAKKRLENILSRSSESKDHNNFRDEDINVHSELVASDSMKWTKNAKLSKLSTRIKRAAALIGDRAQQIASKRRNPKVLLAQMPRGPKNATKTTTTTTTTSTTTIATTSIDRQSDESTETSDEKDSESGDYEADEDSEETTPAVVIKETTTEENTEESVSKVDSKSKSKASSNSINSSSKKQSNEKKERKSEVSGKKAITNEDKSVSSGSVIKTSNATLTSTSTATTKKKIKKKPPFANPFIKPKNESACTPEAYLEFPRDLIGNTWRARGFVLIHIAVVCYMFYSLALVCERYFMPSLEEFALRLGLSEDVAGATLMSAGSSAPELFTAILGVFIAKGDVGTGAIVGSAVFNILFVIGICAFVSTSTAQLNWWPVLRDSVFYTFTVLVLILFIYDERITALESFSMLALYGLYILVMIHNDSIKEQVTRGLNSHPITAKLLSAAASVDGPDDVFGSSSSTNPLNYATNQKNYQTTSMIDGSQGSEKKVEDDSMFLAALLVIVQHKRLFGSQLRFQSAARYIITKRQHKSMQQQKSKKYYNQVNYFGPENEPIKDGHQKDRMEAYARTSTMSKNKFSIISKDDYEFWNRPLQEGENYYIWLAKIPVNYVLHYTTPDCTLYPDQYLLSFIISIIWTAFFSYIMVWMVTLIGYTLGIPDSIMGFTFLAAGTSIPDCYSSIHAARNGMANMAVSNSIGSNIFDILIGLSLPWFIQTAIYPGVIATINSRGIIYSVILLFLSLVVTIYLMNKYEWTLKPRLGLALLIAYGLFIVLTCMLEFNLFGHVNPPPCP